MSEADWDLYERSGREAIKATRDIVATDGMEITLGESTVRVYLTPGHTHGTISTVLPVHDNGEPHVAAVWGGTAFNFRDSPEDPRQGRLQDYAESASRFSEIISDAGGDTNMQPEMTEEEIAGNNGLKMVIDLRAHLKEHKDKLKPATEDEPTFNQILAQLNVAKRGAQRAPVKSASRESDLEA